MKETQGQRKHETPGLIAGWSLTGACNLRCTHCYNASGRPGKDELTTEEALQVVEKLALSGVTAVNFGGGECALRRDFLEICEALHSKGIRISYTTNGTTLHLILHKLHLFHDIGVSIDFADAERHDSFRGVKGTYDKALDCINQLVSAGVNTEIVTCLTRLNSGREELERLFELAKSQRVNFWRLNRFRPTGRGAADSSLMLDVESLKTAFDFLNSKLGQDAYASEPMFRAVYGGRYHIAGDPSGRYSFRIQTNGEVTPSVFLTESGGNIKTKPIWEILASPVFEKLRTRQASGKCKQCYEYYHCRGGDAGMSYLAYGHFHGPDPLCFKQLHQTKSRAVELQPSDDPNVHELYLCTLYIPIEGELHE